MGLFCYGAYMKILIVGDVHMSIVNMDNILDYAESHGCEKIIVLGDFGYWPHDTEGKAFLFYLNRELARRNIEVHFIKGNHDNHDYLNAYIGEKGVVEIMPKLYFHPNLTTWTWGAYVFCAVGGAYSTDGWKRTVGVDKWHGEEITMAEVYGCSGIEADVVLSHDCPISVDITEHLNNKTDPFTKGHREKLQSIVDEICPEIVFHGHYHKRFDLTGTHTRGTFRNIGLASNKQTLALQCLVFDCDAMYHDFSVRHFNIQAD